MTRSGCIAHTKLARMYNEIYCPSLIVVTQHLYVIVHVLYNKPVHAVSVCITMYLCLHYEIKVDSVTLSCIHLC